MWTVESIKPNVDEWVIVKDKDEREFRNHKWNGSLWYEYVCDDENGYDGYPSDVEIVEWRYEKMTKQEAIENHRKLWNWIADTSEKENRCVKKEEYFEINNLEPIIAYCYCCEYSYMYCNCCPIKWIGTGKTSLPCMTSDCRGSLSEYSMFCGACRNNDVKECVHMARIIANLPENQDVE